MSPQGMERLQSNSKGLTGANRSSKRGFTLVEVVVAMLVIGVALTAAFATMGQGYRLVEDARDYTRVAQILQSEIEDLKTQNWSHLETQVGAEYVKIDLGADFKMLFGDRYQVYRWVRKRVEGAAVIPDQMELRVKARWQNDKGLWNEKETVAWYTKDGMHDYYYRSF